MSRTEKFLDGVVSGYGYQALVLLTGLWLTPFLLSRLGDKDYGLWLIGMQVISYLMLADLGVIALLPRSVAAATGSAKPNERDAAVSRVLGGTLTTVLWQTAIVALASLGAWLWLVREWPSLTVPSAWIFGAFVVLFPARVFGAALQGLQEQGFVARVQSVAWAAGTLVNIGLVIVGAGLYALAAGWIGTQALASAVQAHRFLTRYPGMRPTRDSLHSAPMREIVGRGLWVSITQLSGTLMNGVDVFLIGRSFGPETTIVYTSTTKLVTIVGNQPQLIMQTAVPAMMELRSSGNREHLSRVVIAPAQAMLLISGILCIPALLFNKSFVSLWVGERYFGGMALTVLAVVRTILTHLNLTFAYAAFASGYERRIAVTSLISSMVAFILMLTLLGPLGLIAIPIAQTIAIVTVGLPANLLIVARDTGRDVRSVIFSVCLLLGSLSAFGFCGFLAVSIREPHTWLALFVSATLVGAVYLAVFLPFAMHSAVAPYLARITSGLHLAIQRHSVRAAGRTT